MARCESDTCYVTRNGTLIFWFLVYMYGAVVTSRIDGRRNSITWPTCDRGWKDEDEVMMTAAAEGLWLVDCDASEATWELFDPPSNDVQLNVRVPEDAINKPGSGLWTDPSVVGVRLKSPFKDVIVMICTDSRRCIADWSDGGNVYYLRASLVHWPSGGEMHCRSNHSNQLPLPRNVINAAGQIVWHLGP